MPNKLQILNVTKLILTFRLIGSDYSLLNRCLLFEVVQRYHHDVAVHTCCKIKESRMRIANIFSISSNKFPDSNRALRIWSNYIGSFTPNKIIPPKICPTFSDLISKLERQEGTFCAEKIPWNRSANSDIDTGLVCTYIWSQRNNGGFIIILWLTGIIVMANVWR